MIATLEKKCTRKEIRAPKLITPEKHYEHYVSTLMELERSDSLPSALQNFADTRRDLAGRDIR